MINGSNKHTTLSRRINNIGVLVLCLPLIGGATVSCNKADSPTAPSTQTKPSIEKKQRADSSYAYVDVNEKISSTASPLGYWKKDLRFPQLRNISNSQTLTTVNESIKRLSDKYKCEKEGDQGFESEVTLANPALFSFKYDAMWMCHAMPHPDSTVGAATYDLETGVELKLADELLDKTTADKLRGKVMSNFKALINEINKTGANCPAPSPGEVFYLKDGLLVFRASYAEHADSACELETGIALTEVKDFFKADSKLLH